MAKVLTAKSVAAMRASGSRREVPDAALPGLYIIVQPSGAKSWAYRYRAGGRTRKLTLGRWPAMSLASAREAAGCAARAVELGGDPGAAKVEAKAEARVARETERDKVKTLVEQFDRRHLATIKSGKQARRYLDRFVIPTWGERDVHAIGKRDVIDLLDKIMDAGTPIVANRALAAIRRFFSWCVERDILERAPTDGVKPPAKEVSRDRVLSDDEIRWLWLACDAVGQPWRQLARILLLTGQRLGEVAAMSDREIAGDVWHLAAARTKNGRAHDVPLSEAALDVLAGVKRIRGERKLIFTTNGQTPLSGFAHGANRLRAAMRAAACAERGEVVELPRWTFHDLRRTAATGLAKLGFPVHIVEAVLNHASGRVSGIAAIYNRYDYHDEARAALAAWARYVLDLVGERKADYVVQLGAAQ